MRGTGPGVRWFVAVVGLAASIAGAALALQQATTGHQPWSAELADNFVFARSIPFVIALGVLVGWLRAASARSAATERRASDGAVRRFSPGTVAGHWVNALGFLLALVTGSWQYLGGVLDAPAPIPLYLLYRLHYLGATLILFSVGNFLTCWWLTGDRSLLVPRGQWIRHFRGLAHELPAPLGAALATLLGLDMKRRPPEVGQFTFYEKLVSFPSWMFVITLITLTGVVKALRYIYPIPGEALYWASTLHVAAMVMIGLKLLDHLRYVFGRWPLVVSMVTGWIGLDYVRRRHPAWYRSIESEPPGVAAARADAVREQPAVAKSVAGGEQ